jgi:hypothetical protein
MPTTPSQQQNSPAPGTPAPGTTSMPNSGASGSSSTVPQTVLKFLPNILDNYDVYTYHWKLFITSLENASAGTIFNLANQIVIAESGVSDLTIDKVELLGIAVPSVEAGTGTQTTIKFEIVEPAGAGLIDKMFYEAVSLGIGNWFVMPVFLQLDFRGRDPVTGQSVQTGAPGLGSQRWVWPVKITNIKANVTQVGTKYEFETILYDELAQSNAYFSVQHNIVLNEVSNFAKAMADLETKLNEDQFEKLFTNYSVPDTYKIIVDQSLATNVTALVADEAKNSSRGGDFINFKEKTASFGAGTSVDKIVDSLLANSAYFAKKLQSTTTRAGVPETISKQTDQMKSLWRIVTETRPIAYDALRQNNAVAITIWIVEYNIGALLVNAPQTGQTANTIPAEIKRFNEYATNRIMNKLYNYIFTGLNDQIINFDLNMNFSFAASLARFGGYYINSTSADKGVKQVQVDAQRDVEQQIAQILQLINNAAPTTNVNSAIAAAKDAALNSALDPTARARYTKLLDYVKPGAPVNFLDIDRQIAAQGGIQADGSESSLSLAARRANTVANNGSLTSPINPNSPAFISDININSAASQQARSTFEAISGGKLRPVVFAESNQDQNAGQGTVANNDPSRARLSSIFSTALYSTLDASLQYIKMTIKGDPYWLFPGSINATSPGILYKSDMPAQDAVALIKSSQKNTTTPTDAAYANILGTDNFIVIRFRTPSIYTDPGEPGTQGIQGVSRISGSGGPLETVDTFSGVYRVITVLSKFERGKFTQELTCMLDPVINIDIDKIRIQIEQAIQDTSPVVPSVTVSPAPTPQIVANTKTQPIFSNSTNIPAGMTPNFPGLPSTNIGPITTGSSNIPTGQFQSVGDLINQTLAASNK